MVIAVVMTSLPATAELECFVVLLTTAFVMDVLVSHYISSSELLTAAVSVWILRPSPTAPAESSECVYERAQGMGRINKVQ